MYNKANENPVYAGFMPRLGAYLIDSAIILCLLFLLRIPIWIIQGIFSNQVFDAHILFQYSCKDIILYFAGRMYFIYSTYTTRTTIGKRLFRLKVVSVAGEKLTWLNVIYRETIGRYLSGLIVFLGYIMIGIDPEKRGFHDMLCDTRVIYSCNHEERIQKED